MLVGFYDAFICTPRRVYSKMSTGERRAGGLRFDVAIPHFNRGDSIHRPLANVVDHPAVSGIIVVDDGSDSENLELLERNLRELRTEKPVRLVRQTKNTGALRTKVRCAEESASDWVLILDSDNTAFWNFLSALQGITDPETQCFYCAAQAYPYYSFESVEGRKLDFAAMAGLAKDGVLGRTYILNDGNYLVNRQFYLECSRDLLGVSSDVADVILFNYRALSKGGALCVLPGTSYLHRIGPDGFYLSTKDASRQRVLEITRRIAQGSPFDDEFLLSLLRGNKT